MMIITTAYLIGLIFSILFTLSYYDNLYLRGYYWPISARWKALATVVFWPIALPVYLIRWLIGK